MCTSASLVFSFACPRMSDVEHFVFHVLVVFWSDSFPQSHNGKPFAVINGSIFLISLPDCLVFVARNAPDFCALPSYPAPLLKLCISPTVFVCVESLGFLPRKCFHHFHF